MFNVFRRISRPCNSKATSYDQCLSSTSSANPALATDVCPPSSDCGLEVSKSKKILEDNSRLSAWLSRLGLSSRIAECTSLLHSVNPLSNNFGSDTANPSSTSVNMGTVSGADDLMKVSSREFPTCRNFVPRMSPPHVGLNSVMSMKRDVSSKSHSVALRFSQNSRSTVSPGTKDSVAVSPSGTRCRVFFAGRTSPVNLVKSSSLSTVDTSLAPSTVLAGFQMQDPSSVFVSACTATVKTCCTATAETCSGRFLSTESTTELLKSATVPAVDVMPDVNSVFSPASATADETVSSFCDNMVSTIGTVSASSPSIEGRKTSTPAKRPQSLDVIPWSPLSRSSCTLTSSLSTVVHSHVSSGSSRSSAAELIPASPVNIPAV